MRRKEWYVTKPFSAYPVPLKDFVIVHFGFMAAQDITQWLKPYRVGDLQGMNAPPDHI